MQHHSYITTDQESNVLVREVEGQEWLRRRRSGEEERVLIADHWVSRGWEAGHVLVVDFDGTYGFENLVMRAVGYCAVVKIVCSD